MKSCPIGFEFFSPIWLLGGHRLLVRLNAFCKMLTVVRVLQVIPWRIWKDEHCQISSHGVLPPTRARWLKLLHGKYVPCTNGVIYCVRYTKRPSAVRFLSHKVLMVSRSFTSEQPCAPKTSFVWHPAGCFSRCENIRAPMSLRCGRIAHHWHQTLQAWIWWTFFRIKNVILQNGGWHTAMSLCLYGWSCIPDMLSCAICDIL